MKISAEDLTAAARIRNAALEGFARNGVEATSIREVAAAAGVSAGLVQHHFKTKADLEQAVGEYVVRLAGETYAEFEEQTKDADSEQLLRRMGDFITAFVRDNRDALLYVIRSAAAGERAGLGLFDSFVAIIQAQIERLDAEGLVREEIDRGWVGLHVIIFNLGTVLLEEAIDRHLPAPLRDPTQLQRWNEATTDLMSHGVIVGESAASSG